MLIKLNDWIHKVLFSLICLFNTLHEVISRWLVEGMHIINKMLVNQGYPTKTTKHLPDTGHFPTFE